jgi:ABC-type antimicrobial peptide transport system permease subunit
VYFSRAQVEPAGQSLRFIVHAQSTTAVLSSVKSVIERNIPQATLDFLTMDSALNESLRLMRAMARLAGFFGILALMLAAIGLYGIMSYGVARRRNEIGVRIALGASQSRVMRMILTDVGRIVGAGVAVGVLLSFVVTKLVVSFLYEIKPNDPTTLAAAALVLIIVGLTAAAIPAWKAARLNPVSALRAD